MGNGIEAGILVTMAGDSSGAQQAMEDFTNDMFLMQKAAFASAIAIGSLMTSIGAGLTAVIGLAISSFGQLQKEMRQVQRIAGLTGSQVDELRGRFVEISGALPVSAQEMARVAVEAGRLGIEGTENIAQFSKTMIEMANTTSATAEQAANSIGRMVRQFGRSMDMANNFGSVVAKLSTTTTATSTDLLQFGERVGALSSRFGISEGAMLAFGAVADEAGLRARTSATQFGKLINRMANNASQFERMIPTLDNVAGQLNENATPAIISLFEHLGKLEATEAQRKLDELGISSQRMAPLVSTLTKDIGRLEEQINTGNEAFDEGTFLAKSYQTAINNVIDDARTLAGTFGNIAKVIGGTLAPIARLVLQTFNMIGQAFLQLPSFVQAGIGVLIGLTGVVLTLSGAFLILFGLFGMVTQVIGQYVSTLVGAVDESAGFIQAVTGVAGAVKRKLAPVFTMFTGHIANAIGEFDLLGDTLKNLSSKPGLGFLDVLGDKIKKSSTLLGQLTHGIGTIFSNAVSLAGEAAGKITSRIKQFGIALLNLNIGEAGSAISGLADDMINLPFGDLTNGASGLNNVMDKLEGKGRSVLSILRNFTLTRNIIDSSTKGFSTLSSVFNSLLGSIPFIGSALASSFLPALLSVATVAGALFVTFMLFKEVFVALWDTAVFAFNAIKNAFMSFVSGFRSGFGFFFDMLANQIQSLITVIGKLFGIFGSGEGAMGGIVSLFQFLGEVIGSLLGLVLMPFIASLRILVSVLRFIGVAISSLLGPIFKVFTPLVDAFSELWESLQLVGEAFSEIFGGSGQEQLSIIHELADIISLTFQKIGVIIASTLVGPILSLAKFTRQMAENIRDTLEMLQLIQPEKEEDRGLSRDSGRRGLGFKIGDFPKLASGGIVTQGTPAIVAENGPEAVIPLDKMDELISEAGGTVVLENNINIDGRTISKIVNSINENEETKTFSKPEMGVTG